MTDLKEDYGFYQITKYFIMYIIMISYINGCHKVIAILLCWNLSLEGKL